MHGTVRHVALLALPLAAFMGFASHSGSAPAQEKPDDPVVATVNGDNIYRSEIEDARRFLSPAVRAYPLASLFDSLLKDMVDSQLAAGEARRLGLAEEPVIKRRLARVAERVLRRELLRRHLAKELAGDGLRQRYDAFIKTRPDVQEVWARHILVETRDKAMAAIRRLDKGENFVTLAQKLSTGPSAVSGGDLGYFTRERMVAEFSRAAFSLQKGQFTREPVRTQFGWHVIKVEGRRTKKPPSFEQAKAEMRQTISREMSDKLIKTLRTKARIETFGLAGKPAGG